MRKVITLGMVFLLVMMSFTSISGIQINNQIIKSSGRDNILYVGGSGEGNYTRIQDAIDNASDGDTVFVYDDNSPYFENLFVDTSIKLIGENKNTTVIDGNERGFVVSIYADWINISGFTLKGGYDGIHIEHTSYVNITDNKITSINNRCIRIEYSDYSIICNNIFKNNKHGISLWCSAHNDISSNIIKYNNGSAISIFWSDTNNIYNNKIENNSGGGITLSDSIGGSILSNNTIKECGFTGVSLRYVKNCLIFRNIIENCGYKGITLSDSSENNISQNKISNNDCGILFGNLQGYVTNYNTISNNIISYNNKSGIHFIYTTKNNIIEGNMVFNNIEFGILIQESNKNIVTGNEIFSNNLGGVGLDYSNNNNIFRNNIFDNSEYGGIFLKSASNDNKLYLNYIANNTFGINILSSINSKIANNNFINNSRDANLIFTSFLNNWGGNYWDKWIGNRINLPIFQKFPKFIFGKFGFGIDWHPAKEPYNITTAQGCGIE